MTDPIIEAIKAAITPITRRDTPEHSWLDADELTEIAKAAHIAGIQALMENVSAYMREEGVAELIMRREHPAIDPVDILASMLAAHLEEME